MSIDAVFLFREVTVMFGIFDSLGMSQFYSTRAIDLHTQANISPTLYGCGKLTLLKPAL